MSREPQRHHLCYSDTSLEGLSSILCIALIILLLILLLLLLILLLFYAKCYLLYSVYITKNAPLNTWRTGEADLRF